MVRVYVGAIIPPMATPSRLGCAAALVLFCAGFVSAPAIAAEAPASDDSKAISGLLARQEAAWNSGDAKGFSEQFDADGSFTNIIGTVLFGREDFERQHARIFSTIYKGSTLKLVVRRIHFPMPDVAVADTDTEVTNYQRLPPGLPVPVDGVLRTRLLQVLVRKNGAWWIVAFHNVAVMPLPAKP
jgi:uncharacterized protein (TIGR02246 family)